MDQQRQHFGQCFGLNGQLGRQGGEDKNGGGGYGGFSGTFNILHMKKPTGSDRPVFLLKADRALYCRGKVFTTFNGESWTSDHANSQIFFAKDGLFYLSDADHDQGG